MMKPRRWWLGLIPLALIWLAAVWFETGSVEQYLASQANEAAKAVPLHKIQVTAAGRDVTVSGETLIEDIRGAAPAAVGAVWGIRRARVETRLIPEAQPFFWSAARTDNSVTLAGNVPSPEARKEIVDAARAKISGRPIRIVYLANLSMREHIGKMTVIDRMSYARGAPEGFAATAEHALAQLGKLTEGKLVINGTSVSISGSAEDDPTRDAITIALGKLPSGFTLATNSITTPERAPPAFPTDVALATLKPPDPPVDAAACQQMFDDALADDAILFAQNSAVIDPDSVDLLKSLVTIAMRCPSSDIEIGGHTDSIGANMYNVVLSRQRAQAVVDYLVDAGLDPSRLTAAGFGSSRPIVPNNTRDGRARNRRIEFHVRKEGP